MSRSKSWTINPPRRSFSPRHTSSISSECRPSRMPSGGRTRSERSSTALSRAGSISLRRAVKKRSQCLRLRSCALPHGFALRHRAGQQLDQSIDRVCLRQVDTALERRLDQAADNFRPADRSPVFQTDVDRQPVEISHVSIEQYDRDFGPRFGVHDRAPTIGFIWSWTHTFLLSISQSRGYVIAGTAKHTLVPSSSPSVNRCRTPFVGPSGTARR